MTYRLTVSLPSTPLELAAAEDESRPVLTRLQYMAELKHWLACDGFMLAASPVNGQFTPIDDLAVPAPVCKLARKLAPTSPSISYTPHTSDDDNRPTFYYSDNGLNWTVQPDHVATYPDASQIMACRLPWPTWPEKNGQRAKPMARPLATLDARELVYQTEDAYQRLDAQDAEDSRRDRGPMAPLGFHYDPEYDAVYFRPWTGLPHKGLTDPQPWPSFTLKLTETWPYQTDGHEDDPPRDNRGTLTQRIFTVDARKLARLAKALTNPGRNRRTKRHEHLITIWTDPNQTPNGSRPLILSAPWSDKEETPDRPRNWGMVMPVYQYK